MITNTCIRLIDGMEEMAVDAQFCRDFGLEDPPTMELCAFDQCPKWVVNSEFGEVSFISNIEHSQLYNTCLLIAIYTSTRAPKVQLRMHRVPPMSGGITYSIAIRTHCPTLLTPPPLRWLLHSTM